MTNRKSHTSFRLVPKSTTVDDLEWPIHTLLQKRCVFQKKKQKIWMKIDPYYQRQKCRPMTLVSGDIRFCGCSRRFPGEGLRASGGARICQRGADHDEREARAYNRGPGSQPPAESRGSVPGGAKAVEVPWSWKLLSVFIQKRDQKLRL